MTTQPLRPEQRRSLELHRAIAVKLTADSASVLAVVPGNVERMRPQVHGPLAHGWLDEWLELSRGDHAALIEAMLAADNHGINMRQVTPFAGVLSRDERFAAMQRAVQPDTLERPAP